MLFPWKEDGVLQRDLGMLAGKPRKDKPVWKNTDSGVWGGEVIAGRKKERSSRNKRDKKEERWFHEWKNIGNLRKKNTDVSHSGIISRICRDLKWKVSWESCLLLPTKATTLLMNLLRTLFQSTLSHHMPFNGITWFLYHPSSYNSMRNNSEHSRQRFPYLRGNIKEAVMENRI